jgi:hypothetical protein
LRRRRYRTQRRDIGSLHRRQSVRLESQHSNVRGGIPARERGLGYAPTGKRDFDILVSLQNFFSGYDDPGTPMDAARGPSATAMNSDDAASGTLDELCGMIGKRDKGICGLGHE